MSGCVCSDKKPVCPPCSCKFAVKTIIVFEKSAVCPAESVSFPSSKICRSRRRTFGCALSASSKSSKEYGLRRTLFTKNPLSENPTYPGGAPISRDTVCASLYSDKSIRIKLFESNSTSAVSFAASVLPTPVGPQNRNDAVAPSASSV